MKKFSRGRLPVNPPPPAAGPAATTPAALSVPSQDYRVLDVWHLHSFLIWCHAQGYVFGRCSGEENTLIVLNNLLTRNQAREICGLAFEFLSEVTSGRYRLLGPDQDHVPRAGS